MTTTVSALDAAHLSSLTTLKNRHSVQWAKAMILGTLLSIPLNRALSYGRPSGDSSSPRIWHMKILSAWWSSGSGGLRPLHDVRGSLSVVPFADVRQYNSEICDHRCGHGHVRLLQLSRCRMASDPLPVTPSA